MNLLGRFQLGQQLAVNFLIMCMQPLAGALHCALRQYLRGA
jgi:hypothetical protein